MKPPSAFIETLQPPIGMKSILTVLILSLLPAIVIAAPGATVLLNEQEVRNLGLEFSIVEESDFEITTFALGRTMAIPENASVISSRVPGRVVENRLEIGEFVEQGDKLVRIESRQPGNPPPSIWLTAPADGHILAMNTVLGAPVDPTDRLAEIADLRRLYLMVKLPQSTAGKIIEGAAARVRFPLRPNQQYKALLRPYTGCALLQDVLSGDGKDKQDFNSTHLIFTVENADGMLRPGMNAECSIILETRSEVLSVPREAVHGGPGERHVYIKHHAIPHAFDRVSVQTGATGNGRVEIVDGLFAGDEVVTRGSYSLGFAGGGGGVSLKEALDAAHGHEHNDDGSEMTPEQQAAAGGDDHGRGDEGSGDPAISMLEMILMATTAMLAVALMVALKKRRGESSPGNPIS